MGMTNATVVITTALAVLCGYAAYQWSHKNKFVEEIGESGVRLDEDLAAANEDAAIEGAADADAARAAPLAANANDPAPEDRLVNRDIGAEFDNDDRARLALEERQQQLIQQMQAGERDEQRVAAWKQKGTVGTKKAKSLARRDQRRAYFEYIRSVADRERERIQLEEDMFGDLVAEEREERERRIAEAKQALDLASQKRRQEEEAERKQRAERRDALLADLAPEKGGVAKLKSDEDIEIAEDFSDVIVLENGEHAIRVTPKSVEAVAHQLKAKGRLEMADLSAILEKAYS